MQATLICGIRATIDLSREIGQEDSVADLIDLLGRTRSAARKHFWGPSRRIWVSGESAQVSWASWA